MRSPWMLLFAALTVLPSTAVALGANRLTGIRVVEREKFTVIEASNSEAPTFSVFKLEDPPRLFVDLANTKVDFDDTVEVYNGVVNQVGTLQFNNHQQPTGRIIVNLRKDALYTVDSNARVVRIVVDGSGRLATADSSAQAREEAEAERAKLAAIKDSLEQARLRHEEQQAKLQTVQSERAEQQQKLKEIQALRDEQLKKLQEIKARAQREIREAEARRAEEGARSDRMAALDREAAGKAVRLEEMERATTETAARLLDVEREAKQKAARIQEIERATALKAAQLEEVERAAALRAAQLEDVERAAAQRAAQLEDVERTTALKAAQLKDVERATALKAAQLKEVERVAAQRATQLEDVERVAAVKAKELADVERATALKAAELKDVERAAAVKAARLQELETTERERSARLAELKSLESERLARLAEIEAEAARKSRELSALEASAGERARGLDEVARIKDMKAAQVAELQQIEAEKVAQLQALKSVEAQRSSQLQAFEETKAERARQLLALQAAEQERAARLQALNAAEQERAVRLEALNAAEAEKAAQIDALRVAQEKKAAQLQALNAIEAEKAAQIEALKVAQEKQAAQLQALNAAEAEKAAQIEALGAVEAEKAAQIQALKVAQEKQAAQLQALNAAEAEKAAQLQALSVAQAEKAAQLAEYDRMEGEKSAQLKALESVEHAKSARIQDLERAETRKTSELAALERAAAEKLAQLAELEQAEAAKARQLDRRERDAARAEGHLRRIQEQRHAEEQLLAEIVAKRAQLGQLSKEKVGRDDTSRRKIEAELVGLKQELVGQQARSRQEMESLKAELAAEQGRARKALASKAAAVSGLKAEIATLKTQLSDTTAARDAAMADAREKDARLSSAMGALDETKRETAARDEEVARLQGEIQKTRFLLTAQKSLTTQERQNLDSLKGRIQRLQGSIHQLKSAHGAADDDKLARHQQELAKLQIESARAEDNLSRLKASRAEDQDRLTQMEQALGSSQGRLQALQAQLAEREAQVAEMSRKMEAQRSAQGQGTARLAELREMSEGLSARLSDKESELSSLHDEIKDLGRAREEDRKALDEARLALVQSLRDNEELERRSRIKVDHLKRENARLTAEREQLEAARKERTSLARVVVEKARDVRDVRFDEKNGTAFVEIVVDQAVQHSLRETADGRHVLELKGARLGKALERVMDVSAFHSAVKTVTSYNDADAPDTALIMADTRAGVRGQVTRQGDRLVWTFTGQKPDRIRPWFPTTVAADAAAASAGGAAGLSLPGGDYGGGAVLNPYPYKKRKKYRGKRINLTIKEADIQDVLSFLAREGSVNIVANDDVSGKVSFHLENIPWDLAFDMILKAKGLDYVKEGEVYRVAPLETIKKEYDILLEKKKQMAALKQLVVRLITVNYADATDLAKRVKNLLSPKGSVDMDDRTNTLIVKDIEEHVIAIEDLVRRLDTQTPQVLIEARIVESTDNFAQEMGIQWGGHLGFDQMHGNQTGLIFPSVIGIGGGSDDPNSPSNGLQTDVPGFAVNLPAASGSGAGGSLGISLGSVGGAANLNLRLSAAEEEGTVKIVSAPKVSTLDNTKASIQQGVSIPISVVSAQGVNTQFFNALLKLEVTPHVTQDGNISLKIDIQKNEPDFAQTGANGNPTIRKKEAHTELLISDGDTTVIGGIYTRNTSKSFKKVPFLADIPLLGPLFKMRKESDSRSELLIFITPRIINRQASEVRTD